MMPRRNFVADFLKGGTNIKEVKQLAEKPREIRH
jgi:hypothetical protein